MHLSMEYAVSIRINFPEDITAILKKEKERFVAEYGSGYKSEPHITLYGDRYTEEGFPRLIHDLKELSLQPFMSSLLEPKARLETYRNRYLYVMDVTNKEKISELRNKVSEVAIPYRSPLLSSKTRQRLEQQGVQTDGTRASVKDAEEAEAFDPHITLGEVGLDALQPDIAIVKKNLEELEGKQIDVSSYVVYFYGKKDGDEKFKLIEKVLIPIS